MTAWHTILMPFTQTVGENDFKASVNSATCVVTLPQSLVAVKSRPSCKYGQVLSYGVHRPSMDHLLTLFSVFHLMSSSPFIVA